MPRAEYIASLKENGATDEDIKLLAEGSGSVAAIRAFDAASARVAAAAAEARKAATDEVNKTWNDFYVNDVTPKYNDMERNLIVAKADAERAKSVLLQSQDEGLRKVAEQMGYKADAVNPNAPKPGDSAPIDLSKYVTTEQAMRLAESEGDAIAMVQDMAAEHATLFPGQRLNWRELRKEAVSRRISVEALWQERYKVPEARAAAVAAADAAREAAIRKDERTKVEMESASRYGNPDQRPLVPSNSPFAPRPATGRDKMPWDRDENEASRDRVTRATQKVLQGTVTH